MTNTLIKKVLNYPKVTLAILSTITVILGSFLPSVKIDFSIEQLFSQNDPVISRFLNFREEFDGVDNRIFLLYESNDPFSYNNLVANQKMVYAFENIQGVSKVTSLTNIELFTDGGEYLLSPVFDYIPQSLDSSKFAKNRILSSELLKNYLISEDGKVAAILVEISEEYNTHVSREVIVEQIDKLQLRTDWTWHQTGLPIIRTRYVQYMIADNITFLLPVLLMLIFLLTILFRSLVGLLLPLLVVLLTIIWTLGFMSAVGITINIISYIIPTLLMVVGISDSVHFLIKYYNTLKEIGDKKKALSESLQKIGTAIFLTSITTAIGFGALSMVKIDIVKEFGGDIPFKRPVHIETDESTTFDVLEHGINFFKNQSVEFDYLVLLEPTSPLRDSNDIDEAIMTLHEKRNIADSIVGVSKVEATHPAFDLSINKAGLIRPYIGESFKVFRRQEIEELYFFEGTVYVSDIQVLLKERSFYHDRTMPLVLPRWKSLEIDEIIDLLTAETVIKNLSLIKKGNYE